ncbi:hypothetical protein O181_017634 [Austropuccinia psidii MF-1]|uniref:Uncharacterized protein n=1 Tax=Austropuccinia psidii MF-1 TaxID=1389203 RepID=A0A9Q3C639_9BASI|nr:hypothetical protein [Austropuccinia psidii MF-1]
MFSPKKTDPFNDHEAWNVPLFTPDPTISIKKVLKSHQPLFQFTQALYVPTLHKKQFWENLILESISVSSKDFIQPEKFKIINSTEDDPLLAQQLSLAFLVYCLRKQPSYTAQKDQKDEIKPINNGIKILISLKYSIIHIIISYNLILAHSKFLPVNISDVFVLTHQKSKHPLKTLLELQYKLGLVKPSYHILASFLASGVRGLMVCSRDWGKGSAKGEFQMLEITASGIAEKRPYYPIWKGTNAYILDIYKKAFFSKTHGFVPTAPKKLEVAKCLVLDFSK